jgi:hypothetical protein
MLTVFLPEMSLKATTARIVATTDLEFYVREAENGGVEVSPLLQELRRQLDIWIENVPTFLNWSSELGKGVYSPLGIRVILMYWFVRFLLIRRFILHILHNSSGLFPVLGWAFFHEGLHAGLTLINASILKRSDIDVIMGNRSAYERNALKFLHHCRTNLYQRIPSVVWLVKECVVKGYVSTARERT